MRVAIPFVIGIFLSLELNIRIDLKLGAVLISALFLVLITLRFTRKKIISGTSGFLVLLSILTIGLVRGSHEKDSLENSSISNLDHQPEGYVLTFTSGLTEKKNSFKRDALITAVKIDDSLHFHHEKTLVYFPKDSLYINSYSVGKIFTGVHPSEIAQPKNPGEFNYAKYLNGLGISHQFYLKPEKFTSVKEENETNFFSFFEELRNKNLEILREAGIEKKAFSVISALVLGDKSHIDDDLYNAYGAAGATHVLAVSGLHVGLIYVIIIWFLKPLFKYKLGRWLGLFLLLLSLWFYAALTGFSPSVLRACTMFTFISFSKIQKQGSNIFNFIAASAVFLLFIKPALIMEVGFQLSYSAVLGILLIQPWLYRQISFKRKLSDKAWQITTVSIAAQLGTFPIGMLYFHQFPNYFLISNLFVIPVATLILYLTLALLAFHWLTLVSSALVFSLNFIITALNSAIEAMELLPYAKTEGIDISIWECFLLYGIIALFILTFIHQRYHLLKYQVGLLAIFFALQCGEAYLQETQSSLTIHVINSSRAITVFHGKKAYCIATENLISDAEKKKFHLSHYWHKQGVYTAEMIEIEEDYHCNAFIKKGNLLFWNNQILELNGDVIYPAVNTVLVNKIGKDPHSQKGTIPLLADGKTAKKYLLKSDESNYSVLKEALIMK